MSLLYENYAFDDFALDAFGAGSSIPPKVTSPPLPFTDGESIQLSNTVQDYEA